MTTPGDARDRLVELPRSTSSLLSVSRDLDQVVDGIAHGMADRIEHSSCHVCLYRRDDGCDRCAA
jgi:hypothetical protein